jgi:hypothetical protein
MRHKTRAIIVLNTKGNIAYPEAKYGHGLSFLETPLENTLPHQTLSKNVEGILTV